MSSLFATLYALIHGKPLVVNNTETQLPQYIKLNPILNLTPKGISGNTLRLVAQRLSQADADLYAKVITDNMEAYDIDQEHLPMFLCQGIVECAYFTKFEEILFYTTTDALKRAWQSRFSDPAFASQYLRNPQKLGNYVYANRYGNGNEASGDGFKHRGRGVYMYTFKDNYIELADHLKKPISLLTTEDKSNYLKSPEGAFKSAMHFWQTRKLNRFTTYDQVDDCTDVINGGQNGIKERQDAFNNIINNTTLG